MEAALASRTSRIVVKLRLATLGKASNALHVAAVLIAEALDQIFLFSSCK
jgi:hypothetical protein